MCVCVWAWELLLNTPRHHHHTVLSMSPAGMARTTANVSGWRNSIRRGMYNAFYQRLNIMSVLLGTVNKKLDWSRTCQFWRSRGCPCPLGSHGWSQCRQSETCQSCLPSSIAMWLGIPESPMAWWYGVFIAPWVISWVISGNKYVIKIPFRTMRPEEVANHGWNKHGLEPNRRSRILYCFMSCWNPIHLSLYPAPMNGRT